MGKIRTIADVEKDFDMKRISDLLVLKKAFETGPLIHNSASQYGNDIEYPQIVRLTAWGYIENTISRVNPGFGDNGHYNVYAITPLGSEWFIENRAELAKYEAEMAGLFEQFNK